MAEVFGHTTRKWNMLVKKFREIDLEGDSLRWTMADLLAQVVPPDMFGKGAPKGVKQNDRKDLPTLREILGAFKKACGTEYTINSLIELRWMGINWPKDIRVEGARWSAHRALVYHPNRAKILRPGMTFKEASRAAGRDVTHLEERVVVKRDISYESVHGKLQWANRLIRSAGIEAVSLQLDYKQRHGLQELVRYGKIAYEDTGELIKSSPNHKADIATKLKGNQNAKGNTPANKGRRNGSSSRSKRRYTKEPS